MYQESCNNALLRTTQQAAGFLPKRSAAEMLNHYSLTFICLA